MAYPRNIMLVFMITAIAAVVASECCGVDELIWEAESGWSDLSEHQEMTVEGLYKRAKALFVRGDISAAAEAFAEVESRFPKSDLAPKAKFARAGCQAKLGRPFDAAQTYAALLAQGADAIPANEIIACQIRVLTEAVSSDPARAVELLHEIAEKASEPTLKYDAYVAEAAVRYDTEEYELAAEAYAAAADAAADNAAIRNAAIFKGGLSNLLACREGEHDEQRLKRARERFRSFLEADEESENARAAQVYLDAIDMVLAESEPAPQAVFYAITYLPEERYRRAEKVFKKARKKFAGTLPGETAAFYQAECLYLRGKIWKAFAFYEQLMEDYPATVYLRQTSNREFAVAEAMLEKGKRKKAISAFEAVAQNDPNGPLADDAQMSLGRLWLEAGKYVRAKDAFASLVMDYPRSEWAHAALFHGAVTDLKNSALASEKEVLLARARRAFELYLHETPTGSFVADAQAFLAECREQQAGELWRIARFYERRKQLQAAAWYDALLVREHPDSAPAGKAGKNLERYKKQGLAFP